jgi:DNA sulfur modification protein DndD
VNAIDDDHREGIRLTLFKDPYFAGKQIILTCHGEEFTKDIQNLIGAVDARTCKSYTFLPHSGDNQIRVEVISTKNHILSARNKLETNELRGCLTDARRGLEWVANTIWTKVLPDSGVRGLSVLLARPGRPELFNLVQSLVKEMNKNSFTNPQKGKLIAGLNSILGLNQSGREWEYLNKGTHEEEDRTEFDRGIVSTVVQALEDLDAAITASRRQLVLLTRTELTA